MIPYGHQDIAEQDIQAVVDVLRSDFLTQGPVLPDFEKAVADYCGAEYGVAVNSGTSALHLACLALGLGPGDTLWTSPITFVASANCAMYCGAQVDFVEIDDDTCNMSMEALAMKLEEASRKGCLPKIVVPVHFAGQPCDMAAIRELSARYGFSIIEDASHALGSSFQGMKTGSCAWSDVTVFSFHPVKMITTGEGGMIMVNDQETWHKLRLLRTHGITRQSGEMAEEGAWYYQQKALGYNYRMSDIQAALGLSQLDRLDEFVERRTAMASRYHEKLADFPLKLPVVDAQSISSWHLYVIRLKDGYGNKSRREVYEELYEVGIGVNVHYIPVHTQPYYEVMGFSTGDFPVAENYYKGTLTIPLFPGLTVDDQEFIIKKLGESLM